MIQMLNHVNLPFCHAEVIGGGEQKGAPMIQIGSQRDHP